MTARRKFAAYSSGFVIWIALAGGAWAQAMAPAEYAQLRAELGGVVRFETLPRRTEPGHILDAVIRTGPLHLGERFAGQALMQRRTRDGGRFDALGPITQGGLRVLAGNEAQNLALAWHRGFGSMALFPLGPAGAARIEGRGEGSVAVLFDEDQPGIGFLLHAGYARMLGGGPAARGAVTVTTYARDGRRIGRVIVMPGDGVQRFAWRRAAGARDIAGFTVENVDPGGIALDDILYARALPLG